jgi:hypothetical protein
MSARHANERFRLPTLRAALIELDGVLVNHASADPAPSGHRTYGV